LLVPIYNDLRENQVFLTFQERCTQDKLKN